MGPRTVSLITNGVVRESKLLWTLGNYSRFVRPGMVRIKCEVAPAQSYENGLLASAYAGTDGRRVVVLVNLSREEMRCDLGFDEKVEVYVTSSETNLKRSQQSSAAIALPARSVGTVLLPPT
jgi:O-glycosyl hydrolase